jgi:tight adherence protein C
MTLLLAGFFVFVVIAVTAGALVYQRIAGEASLAVQEEESLGAGLLVSLGRVLGSFQKDGSLRSLLFRAGHRSPSAVAMFHGTQVAAGVGMALIADWIVLWQQGSSNNSLLLPAFCGLGFGYLMPKRILEWQVSSRAHRLRSALPPALDLMVLGLEAGQTIDQGILESARSIGRVYPDLASELTFCSLEMRAGTPRGEALRRMGERCGEEEIRKLVTVLVDGERFGSSLGPALRSHAHYLRTRMRHRAQEASRKLTVKLVMPVFFLIFPSVLLVTLGPAYLQLRQFLGKLVE